MSESSFVSRRRLLGLAAAGAGGLALAACGSGGTTAGTTGQQTTTAPATGSGTAGGSSGSAGSSAAPSGKKGGTFRFSPDGFAGTTTLDPLALGAGYAASWAMFNPLLKRDHQNKIVPVLAESFEAEAGDQSVWTLRLRDGVTFHNGKTISADDVLYTLGKILDPKNPGPNTNLLSAIDLSASKKMDARTVRLKLKYPHSQIRDGFASSSSALIPVDFDPKNPVGTGPFKHKDFVTAQKWTGVRNDDYWEGQVFLDQLELFGFNDTTARLNALLAGQIDGIEGVQPAQLPQLKTRTNLQILQSESGAYQVFAMKSEKGALFEDVRVRQAFKLLVDRQQMINVAWGGYGKIGYDTGVWHEFDPAMAELPDPKHDVDQAKSLLKAAGKEGMSLKLRTSALSVGQLESAQILQQNAKAAGVTIELDIVANRAQYYTDEYYSAPFESDSDSTETMYALAAYAFTEKGTYNTTGYSDPRVNSLLKEALASTQDKYVELMNELSTIISQEGPWIVWGRRDALHAYSNKFTGAASDASGRFNGFDWTTISQV